MPLEYEVTDLETVPEALRSEYTEEQFNGAKVYRLALNLPKGIKSVMDKERSNTQTAQRETAQHRDELAALRAKYAAIDGLDPLTLAEELANERTHREAATARLSTALKASSIAAACAAAQGNPKLLSPMLEKRTSVVDGKVVVLDEDGTPSDMSVSELLAELREDPMFFGAFAGTGRSGGGSSGVDGGKSARSMSVPSGPQRRSQMDVRAKVAYINEHGQDAFMNLPY